MAERVGAGRSRRPFVVVALGSALVALGHALWIWSHRRLGAFDPDEAGYIATAFRYHRTFDLTDPMPFVRAVGGTGFGPLVPLLSFPLLWIGPDDPRTVMMIQPVLMVVGALAVCGATRRVASDGAAVAAGLTFAVVPTVITATQTYWFGLGGGVALAVAVWGLLASDGCRTRAVWWFGAGLGCMLLARTMTLGYLPGALAAGLVVMRRERLAVRRVAEAVAIMVVLAAPWWIVEWPTISDYLFSYGYGPTAAVYGSGGVWTRLGFRLDRIGEMVGTPVAVTAVAVVAGVGVGALVRSRGVRSERARAGVALAVGSLAGLVALVSTTNSGVWFELPLLAFLLPLAAMMIDAAPSVLGDRLGRVARVAVVAPVVGMAVVQTPVSWWWLAPTTEGVPWLARNHLTSSQQEPAFAEYDGRFSTANRGQEIEAAAQWWALSERVASETAAIERSTDRPVQFWFSGSFEMFNTNTLTLAEELRGRETAFHIPETRQSPARRAADLTPDAPTDPGEPRAERVLVVALHDFIRFPPDTDVEGFARQARRAGWEVVWRRPLPGDGEVQILRRDLTDG